MQLPPTTLMLAPSRSTQHAVTTHASYTHPPTAVPHPSQANDGAQSAKLLYLRNPGEICRSHNCTQTNSLTLSTPQSNETMRTNALERLLKDETDRDPLTFIPFMPNSKPTRPHLRKHPPIAPIIAWKSGNSNCCGLQHLSPSAEGPDPNRSTTYPQQVAYC